MIVTVILKEKDKMFGYSSSTQMDKTRIKEELEKKFGGKIVLLKFKE